MWERQETMIWNAIQSFEQTKVANKDSASKMRGGPSLQRIVVSVILNSQLSAVSQSLTPNSQISVLNSQIKLSSQFQSPDSQIPKSQFSASNSQFPVLKFQIPISNLPLPGPKPQFANSNSQVPIPNSQLLIPKSQLPNPHSPTAHSKCSTPDSKFPTKPLTAQSPTHKSPMAQLGWRLIPYTAHLGVGDGAPSVHTDARASGCPGEVDGYARAYVCKFGAPSPKPECAV